MVNTNITMHSVVKRVYPVLTTKKEQKLMQRRLYSACRACRINPDQVLTCSRIAELTFLYRCPNWRLAYLVVDSFYDKIRI